MSSAVVTASAAVLSRAHTAMQESLRQAVLAVAMGATERAQDLAPVPSVAEKVSAIKVVSAGGTRSTEVQP